MISKSESARPINPCHGHGDNGPVRRFSQFSMAMPYIALKPLHLRFGKVLSNVFSAQTHKDHKLSGVVISQILPSKYASIFLFSFNRDSHRSVCATVIADSTFHDVLVLTSLQRFSQPCIR